MKSITVRYIKRLWAANWDVDDIISSLNLNASRSEVQSVINSNLFKSIKLPGSKVCNVCKQDLSIKEFTAFTYTCRHGKRRARVLYRCKACVSSYGSKHHLKIKEKTNLRHREHYAENKSHIAERFKQRYYSDEREHMMAIRKKAFEKTRDNLTSGYLTVALKAQGIEITPENLLIKECDILVHRIRKTIKDREGSSD